MKRAALIAALLGVVALAAFLRRGVLALPHDKGDQVIWAGVAHNVRARGPVEGYTLRGVGARYEPRGDGLTTWLRFAAVPPPGDVLQAFIQDGEAYWDAPLVNQPPGFFAILLASHALLGERGDGFPILALDPQLRRSHHEDFVARTRDGFERRVAAILSSTASPDEKARSVKEVEAQAFEVQVAWQAALARAIAARGVATEQLWATLPVLLADLLAVGLVFALALRRGAPLLLAAIAALAYATDPIALFCAHRILSNAPLAAACALCLFAEEEALAADGRRRVVASVGVGALAALAISIKVSAVFLLPAIVIGRLLRRKLDRSVLALGLVALAVAAPWWLLQWKVLGHPFGFAWRRQADRAQVSAWGRLVTFRDATYYARSLARSPLLLAGGVAGLVAAARARGDARGVTGTIFAALVIAAAARFEEKEARHLLLAYPVLAANLVHVPRVGRRGAIVLVLAALAALAWQAGHGTRLAYDLARAP